MHSKHDKAENIGDAVGVPEHAAQYIGTKMGDYQIQSFLAQGGMGCVFLAKHSMLKRLCVIKMLRPSLLQEPEMIQRFMREMHISGSLDHPNIIRTFDASIHKGICYLVTEYFAGRTLDDLFEGHPAPLDLVVNIGTQVASTLDAAHARHIVHRDVKPSNILINKEGYAKVLDFGVAKALTSSSDASITHCGCFVGSPSFAAPEQVDVSMELTPLADQYGLGAVLYFCLTGLSPYSGKSDREILRKIGSPFPPPSRLRSEVPRELEQIVLKAMAPAPEDRYESMLALGDALRTVNMGAYEDSTVVMRSPEHQDMLETRIVTDDTQSEDAKDDSLPHLRIFGPESGCRTVSLTSPRITMGRSPSNDIYLDDPTISRHHATIVCEEGTCVIEDNQSKLGIRVNGSRVKRAELQHGLNIQIANFVLEYRDTGQLIELPEDTPEPTRDYVSLLFNYLPVGMEVSYRCLGHSPEKLFHAGDTLPVGNGGILILSHRALEKGMCLEVELKWPNRMRKRFLGENMCVVRKPQKWTARETEAWIMCVKLHQVSQEKQKRLLDSGKSSPWIKGLKVE